jgi:hypothetical protein
MAGAQEDVQRSRLYQGTADLSVAVQLASPGGCRVAADGGDGSSPHSICQVLLKHTVGGGVATSVEFDLCCAFDAFVNARATS